MNLLHELASVLFSVEVALKPFVPFELLVVPGSPLTWKVPPGGVHEVQLEQRLRGQGAPAQRGRAGAEPLLLPGERGGDDARGPAGRRGWLPAPLLLLLHGPPGAPDGARHNTVFHSI